MKTHKIVLLCVTVCLMVLAACPVYANWMPTAGELGNMFGQAMGEQIGEAIGRQIWGDKVYDDTLTDCPTMLRTLSPQHRNINIQHRQNRGGNSGRAKILRNHITEKSGAV